MICFYFIGLFGRVIKGWWWIGVLYVKKRFYYRGMEYCVCLLNIDVWFFVIGSIDIRFKVFYKLRNMVESEIVMFVNIVFL